MADRHGRKVKRDAGTGTPAPTRRRELTDLQSIPTVSQWGASDMGGASPGVQEVATPQVDGEIGLVAETRPDEVLGPSADRGGEDHGGAQLPIIGPVVGGIPEQRLESVEENALDAQFQEARRHRGRAQEDGAALPPAHGEPIPEGGGGQHAALDLPLRGLGAGLGRAEDWLAVGCHRCWAQSQRQVHRPGMLRTELPVLEHAQLAAQLLEIEEDRPRHRGLVQVIAAPVRQAFEGRQHQRPTGPQAPGQQRRSQKGVAAQIEPFLRMDPIEQEPRCRIRRRAARRGLGREAHRHEPGH